MGRLATWFVLRWCSKRALLLMPVDRVHEIAYRAGGAATAPLLRDHPDYVFPAVECAAGVRVVLDEFGIPRMLGYDGCWRSDA